MTARATYCRMARQMAVEAEHMFRHGRAAASGTARRRFMAEGDYYRRKALDYYRLARRNEP